jgi:hypothetical protein
MNTKITLEINYTPKVIKNYFEYCKSSNSDKWLNVTFLDDSYENISLADLTNFYTQNKAEIDNQEKIIKFNKLRNSMMNQFVPLLTGMAIQETFKTKGSNEEKTIFTNQQIKDWGDYIGQIAKDGQDLSLYTLSQINPSMFGAMPDLPIEYQNIASGGL